MGADLNDVTAAIGVLGKHLLAGCKVSWTIKMGFCATHIFCNRQARLVLLADGYVKAAGFLECYRRELDLGVCWPDSGWGSIHHFYHAQTGTGLAGMAGADIIAERFYKKALNLWRQGSFKKSMFFLGAVTHLLQDVCEPHHAGCSLGIGHNTYERWVQEHRTDYSARSEGIYKRYCGPVEYLSDCARKSYPLLDLVRAKKKVKYYEQATAYLLPYTQRITAGFWLNFLEQVGAMADVKPRLCYIPERRIK